MSMPWHALELQGWMLVLVVVELPLPPEARLVQLQLCPWFLFGREIPPCPWWRCRTAKPSYYYRQEGDWLTPSMAWKEPVDELLPPMPWDVRCLVASAETFACLGLDDAPLCCGGRDQPAPPSCIRRSL